jgi:hypothetical protein
MLRFVRLATVVLLASFTGCSDSTGPVSLGLNRLRWENQNLLDYVYTARRGCFCPESGQEVLVTVLADRVASVRVVATGVEVNPAGWYTVPELFDLVDQSLGGSYTRVGVEYHQELGYPTEIDLVCDDTTLDCGLRLEIWDLNGPVPFD